MKQTTRNEVPVVDLVGVYHGESNIPSDVFVRREGYDESEFDLAVKIAHAEGIALMRSIAEAHGRNGVPDDELCRVENLGSQISEELLGALGAKAVKPVTPGALLHVIGANEELGIRIHEISGQGSR